MLLATLISRVSPQSRQIAPKAADLVSELERAERERRLLEKERDAFLVVMQDVESGSMPARDRHIVDDWQSLAREERTALREHQRVRDHIYYMLEDANVSPTRHHHHNHVPADPAYAN